LSLARRMSVPRSPAVLDGQNGLICRSRTAQLGVPRRRVSGQPWASAGAASVLFRVSDGPRSGQLCHEACQPTTSGSPGRALVAWSRSDVTGRPRKRPDRVLADKAYSSPSTRRALRKRGIAFTSPEKKDHAANRLRRGSAGGRPPVFDLEVYKGRNVVERCFQPAQAVPCPGHPLHQTRRLLPHRAHPRRDRPLAPRFTGHGLAHTPPDYVVAMIAGQPLGDAPHRTLRAWSWCVWTRTRAGGTSRTYPRRARRTAASSSRPPNCEDPAPVATEVRTGSVSSRVRGAAGWVRDSAVVSRAKLRVLEHSSVRVVRAVLRGWGLLHWVTGGPDTPGRGLAGSRQDDRDHRARDAR
jgi:hypothetical protein